MQSWPNLFIAGAPRCGTSSLHSYLQVIPGIYMSRIKEPNYFSRAVIGDGHPMVKPIRDEGQYLALFKEAGNARVIGEASPNYLEDPEAPALIERTVPGSKVIASLRDPVERLYSNYLMMKNNRPGMGSFMQEIERGLANQVSRSLGVLAPATGLYSQQVERYQAIFGDERFLVLVFEEWRSDVPSALQRILRFLDIQYDVSGFSEPPQRSFSEARGPLVRYLFGNRTISRASEALIPFRLRKLVRNAFLVRDVPKPPMEPEAREYLIQHYRDDVQKLEELLGRSLPWRNFAKRAQARNTG